MDNYELAYCTECDDFVEYDVKEELVSEDYKGVMVSYKFGVGRCKCCGCEVQTSGDYYYKKSEAKRNAFVKQKGLISKGDISEIMAKYDVGKETLADIAGFGKVTIKRYFEGYFPSKEYSDILYRILNDEEYYIKKVEENKAKLKDVTYRKVISRYKRLVELNQSKTNQVVNYIITRMGEVTPLALEKLLFFANGVSYAICGTRLLQEECQAWERGPVYPRVYNRYKKFGYKPIDDGIFSTHGWMMSKVSDEEKEVIDIVIDSFGIYSPKVLERVSQMQDPWKNKRVGCIGDDSSQETIKEEEIKAYYISHSLTTKEAIISYVMAGI